MFGMHLKSSQLIIHSPKLIFADVFIITLSIFVKITEVVSYKDE